MADPFSLGASILGVVGLTVQIGEILVKFSKNWSNAPEDVKGFIQEIQTLKTMLSMTYTNAITNPEFAKAMEGKESALLTHLSPGHKSFPEKKFGLTLDTCKGRLEKLLTKLNKAAKGDQYGWNRLKIAFSTSDIHDTVIDLHRQCQILNNLVALDSLTLSMETLNEVRAARKETDEDRQTRQHWESKNDSQMSELKDGLDGIGYNDQHRERSRILNLISPHNYASQQRDFLSKKTEGTGKWLLESAEYQSWLTATGQTLFCYGMPGSGKTIMSSIVIDDLMDRNLETSEVYLAHIFCNFRMQHDQTTENMFSSILRQLVQQQNEIPGYVRDIYSRDKNLPGLAQIKLAAEKAAKGFKKGGFIIVDALDELSNLNGRHLISQLFELQKDTGVKLFVTSRQVMMIEGMFSQSTKLEIRATDEDVEKYVQSRLHELPRYVHKDRRLQDKIQSTIVKHVQGMFLLAQLHIDSLLNKKSATVMRNALKDLDGGKYPYFKAYDKAMYRIDDQDGDRRDLAHHVLYWITFAKRPLTTKELQHALAVDLDAFSCDSFDSDNITDLELIVSVCAGLVTIDTEANVIRLVHHTTQQYFDRTKDQVFAGANWYIACVCMKYLSYQNVASGAFSSREEHDQRLRNWPLFGYASQYWHEHIDSNNRSQDITIQNFLEAAQVVTPAYQAAVIAHYAHFQDSNYYFVNWDFDSEGAQQPMGLHWAAFIGHDILVRKFLESGFEPEQEDFEGMTPVMVASRQGHGGTVEMMLKEWQIIAEPSKRGHSPLIYATTFDQEEVVKVLLQHADIGDTGTASLGQAIALGRTSIVKLLLADSRIQENVESPDGNSGLTIAVKSGFVEIVQALLSVEDLDVDFTDCDGRTALHLAVQHDQKDIAALLLDDPRVDESIEDEQGQTPLWLAADLGRTEMVTRLLAKPGIDSNPRDDKGRTPLIAAVQNLHLEVVSLLLSALNTDINAQDNYGTTAFCLAANRDPPEMIEPSTPPPSSASSDTINGDQGRNRRHIEIVKALLGAKGIDPELKDNQGWSPLFHAASRGHGAVIALLLLSPGVSVDRLGASGRTALFHARDAAAAQQLVEAGADLEWRDAAGLTPLAHHYRNRVSRESRAVVEFLCRQGADLTCTDGPEGETLLLRAARRGDAWMVGLLLGNGADANQGSKSGKTALLEALRESPKAVSDAFVEKMARLKTAGARFEFEFDREVLADADPGAARSDVIRRYRAIVGLLLKWGADRDAISQLDLLKLKSRKMDMPDSKMSS